MRKRKWALFAFIGLLAFIFISLEGWRLFKANEKLKDFILQEFRPIVGDQLHISKVHVSFGNIHILDVQFLSPTSNISIDIRDLRIGYNFFNLLVRGFDPQYISRDALFVGPTISIRPLAEEKPAKEGQSQQKAKRKQINAPHFKELDLFSHISIKDGEIVYEKNDSTDVMLVHAIQGGIYRQKGDSLFVHLDGAFYNSEKQNIRIIGTGDYSTQRISRLNAILEQYDLQHGLPLVDDQDFRLKAGHLTGSLNMLWLNFNQRYAFTGNVNVKDAAGDLLEDAFTVDSMHAEIVLKDDKLFIQNSRQIINNSPVTISGELNNLNDPQLDLLVESSELELTEFAHLFGLGDGHDLRGKTAIKASVVGPLDKPAIRSNISAKQIRFNKLTIEEFYADARFKGRSVNIDSSSAFLYNNKMSLNGSVDLALEHNYVNVTLRGEGDGGALLPMLGADSSLETYAFLNASVSGLLKNPYLHGMLDINAKDSSSNDSLKVAADFSYHDKLLTIRADSSQNDFYFNSSLNWQKSPLAIHLELEQLQRVAPVLLDWPERQIFNENMRSTLEVSGDLDRFTVNSDVITLSGGLFREHLLNVNASIDRRYSSLRSSGRFTLYPMSEFAATAEFAWEKKDSRIKIHRFDINDKLFSHLDIDLANGKSLDGKVIATAFDISGLSGKSDSSLAGVVDLDLKVGGTLNVPSLDGSVHIKDILYNDAGPYESFVNFKYDSSRLDLERFLLNFGASTLLYAQGGYDAKNDSMRLSIKGAGFDVGQILGAAGKDSLISGETLIDLGISGSAREPDVRGIVAIQNGRLGAVPFDEVELKLGATQDTLAVSHAAIHIENFRLSRFNVYEMTGHGYYPFRSTDPLNLEVNGQGNFLQILNDLSPYFKAPFGLCEFRSRIRGTPLKPELDAANLTIENANMEFKSVVSPLSNVRAELDFDPDEQFLRLSYLEGLMGGRPFFISNTLAQHVVSAKPLQNIHIGDSDFHFGVLVVQTPKKGVPLNFVGLMEPGEFGMLDLLGREPDEKFYFAALPDGLTLRGRINLYDAEIMYPFYDDVKIGSGGVRDFLRNLIWDLYVVPTKNTRFVRSFPGAIDEIYVDLKLDEDFGGLEFTDRLENETFRINGHVRSTKGLIDYLDMAFRVERAGVEFDRSSLVPVAYGSAKTTVTDSLGISSNILLTLQTVDNTMDKKSVDDIVRQEQGRARFNQFRFKLSTDNPNIGSSEAQILASLGYSANNLQNSALSAIGYGTDNLIFRPLFRPVEKELEQTFGLDYVRFSSQVTKNLILFNLNNNLQLNSRLALLESTKIIVGKYLANRFFLQYTGQIESGVGYRYKQKHLGLHHTVGLEYQIHPQILVELEYDYDSLMLENRDDKRIILRHWFPF